MASTASAADSREPEVGVGGEPLGGAGGGGEQAEEQQRADGLGRLGGGAPRRTRNTQPESADRDAARRRRRRGRRWRTAAAGRSRAQPRRSPRARSARRAGLGWRRAEDRAEQGAGAEQAVAASGAGAEQREEEDAEAEDPGEDDPDRDVVGARALAEAPSRSATRIVAANRPSRMSTPAAAAASAPVNATWLSASPANTCAAEHDEVADQPARQRDRGAGEERVADELVGEHQARACDGRERAAQQRRVVGRRRGAIRARRT